MLPAADSSVPDTQFTFRDETAETGAVYVIWAAVAAHRVKGQAPFICAATKDETSARMEYNIWRKAFAANQGSARAAQDALWAVKFGGAIG